MFASMAPSIKDLSVLKPSSTGDDVHSLTLRVFRCLIADLCQQFNGGHPGGAMGMAAIGISLWKYIMKYSPNDPTFFNRDRFVLSNGHTCLFQYAFHHLVGYKHMTLDQLKTYHSSEWESFCPGHPEIEHPGVEVTTGPLGQGIANAVGLAVASKQLAATYNREGFPVVNNTTWCMVGDACLQEGVALEAISLAGHFKLNNLVVMYDNNQITCDGSVDLTNTEDINAKMRACGWQVIDVEDGCYDIPRIVEAMNMAKASTDKPTFINIKTIIGVGSAVQGDAKAHGAAFGEPDVRNIKIVNGLDPDTKFYIPDEIYEFFADIRPRGDALVKEWDELIGSYGKAYPELAEEFACRRRGELRADWKSFIPDSFPDSPTASRKSSGLAFNPVAKNCNSFIVGTADLSPSVNMIWSGKVDFQHPGLQTNCGITGNYGGRYIHWGIREHAMAAISNGIAAFNKGTFIPVTSSFFMFYLYAAPAVRMGSLMELQVIHVATHDSIGTGEDGPTHQPIALPALYRAMPNLLYIRPCDSEETVGAWTVAIEAKNFSSIISLSRQNLPQYPAYSRRDSVKFGAYIFRENPNAAVTLIGVGAEMCFAVEGAKVLASRGIQTRIVSFPCQRLFEQQSRDYKRCVLKRYEIPAVVIEAYAVNGWERYSDAGINMKTFGKSLPGAEAYRYFGFDAASVADKVEGYLKMSRGDKSLRFEFQDL
ncbi:Transketolase, thiamine diphosphate binding domain-containing protein [Lipomyces orientalis]|uniref:Transketolase, thiamine diphosphate binding domain-containing protein n=1 Tax=Lipomyces orientalis TaxID=1233043 RepID=A0ACC3TMM4_9ASCO